MFKTHAHFLLQASDALNRPPPRRPRYGENDHAMDQSPTNNQADPGIWDQGIRNTQGSAAAAMGKGGSLAGGRQITRNRASYSCHSCRRRKVKCDKVRAVFLRFECLPYTDCTRFIPFVEIAQRMETNACTMRRRSRKMPNRARDK